jgi:hypothetical protein
MNFQGWRRTVARQLLPAIGLIGVIVVSGCRAPLNYQYTGEVQLYRVERLPGESGADIADLGRLVPMDRAVSDRDGVDALSGENVTSGRRAPGAEARSASRQGRAAAAGVTASAADSEGAGAGASGVSGARMQDSGRMRNQKQQTRPVCISVSRIFAKFLAEPGGNREVLAVCEIDDGQSLTRRICFQDEFQVHGALLNFRDAVVYGPANVELDQPITLRFFLVEIDEAEQKQAREILSRIASLTGSLSGSGQIFGDTAVQIIRAIIDMNADDRELYFSFTIYPRDLPEEEVTDYVLLKREVSRKLASAWEAMLPIHTDLSYPFGFGVPEGCGDCNQMLQKHIADQDASPHSNIVHADGQLWQHNRYEKMIRQAKATCPQLRGQYEAIFRRQDEAYHAEKRKERRAKDAERALEDFGFTDVLMAPANFAQDFADTVVQPQHPDVLAEINAVTRDVTSEDDLKDSEESEDTNKEGAEGQKPPKEDVPSAPTAPRKIDSSARGARKTTPPSAWSAPKKADVAVAAEPLSWENLVKAYSAYQSKTYVSFCIRTDLEADQEERMKRDAQELTKVISLLLNAKLPMEVKQPLIDAARQSLDRAFEDLQQDAGSQHEETDRSSRRP